MFIFRVIEDMGLSVREAVEIWAMIMKYRDKRVTTEEADAHQEQYIGSG